MLVIDFKPSDIHTEWAWHRKLIILVQSFLLTNARIVDYPIVYCNDGFAKMTGYSRVDIMQKSGNCSYLYGDQTTQEMKDRLVQALDGQSKEQLEILLYKKNREFFALYYFL